jgi:hypothetical protein
MDLEIERLRNKGVYIDHGTPSEDGSNMPSEPVTKRPSDLALLRKEEAERDGPQLTLNPKLEVGEENMAEITAAIIEMIIAYFPEAERHGHTDFEHYRALFEDFVNQYSVLNTKSRLYNLRIVKVEGEESKSPFNIPGQINSALIERDESKRVSECEMYFMADIATIAALQCLTKSGYNLASWDHEDLEIMINHIIIYLKINLYGISAYNSMLAGLRALIREDKSIAESVEAKLKSSRLKGGIFASNLNAKITKSQMLHLLALIGFDPELSSLENLINSFGPSSLTESNRRGWTTMIGALKSIPEFRPVEPFITDTTPGHKGVWKVDPQQLRARVRPKKASLLPYESGLEQFLADHRASSLIQRHKSLEHDRLTVLSAKSTIYVRT